MKIFVALETKRLTVRTLREEDYPDFLEYVMDAELCRMLGWQEKQNESEAKQQFDRLLQAKSYLGVVLKENGKMIGNIGLGNVKHIPSLAMVLEKDPVMKDLRGCSLSFALSADYRRKGIITEAVIGVMDLLFKNDFYDYMNCGYFTFNDPSRHLQEKLGFHYYCTHRFGMMPDGPEIIENILMKDEFQKLYH